jgi:hypothetical protein
MACPWHNVPEATSENGDVKEAPTIGLETTTLVVELEVLWTTVMFTLAVHEAPWLPHDFTCRTWAPRGEETLAVIELPDAVVVLELLSREKPIAEIACEEHGLAVAAKVKGEVTVAPFAGLLTVTLARAGAAHSSARTDRQRAFIERPYHFSADTHRLARSRSCRGQAWVPGRTGQDTQHASKIYTTVFFAALLLLMTVT